MTYFSTDEQLSLPCLVVNHQKGGNFVGPLEIPLLKPIVRILTFLHITTTFYYRRNPLER